MKFIFKKVTDVASTPFFKMYCTADTLRGNIAKCFEQLSREVLLLNVFSQVFKNQFDKV